MVHFYVTIGVVQQPYVKRPDVSEPPQLAGDDRTTDALHLRPYDGDDI